VLQKGPTGSVFFRFVPEEQASKLKDLSPEEQLIFNAVSDSGNAGALSS
jgi:DNA-directed RNA polymerase III subunit RPC6